MATGWTWEYVWEHMTLERLGAMQRLWKKCPPPHMNLIQIAALLKAFMGVEDEKDITPPRTKKPAPEFVNRLDVEE